jgi:hypothetical protein
MSRYLTLTLLLLAAVAGTARAQSLADVAKKEEERRKAMPPPTKVYTNKDLVETPSDSIPRPAGDASKDADKTKAADSDTKDAPKDSDNKGGEKKDQAYWSGRLKTLQTQRDRDKEFADALQTKVNSLTTDFVNRDDPAQRAVIARDRQKALDEIARLKKAVTDDEKAIADLQEEARRQGVPPGWLR